MRQVERGIENKENKISQCTEKGPFLNLGRNVLWFSLWETIQRFHRKERIELPFVQVMPFLDISSPDTEV